MNLRTKGIFSSLASFIVLFSPVEAIGVSNEDNSLLLIKPQIVSFENGQKDNTENNQNNDPESPILEEIKSHTDAILTIVKDNSKQTSPDQVKSWADASWSIFLNIVCWSLFLGLLFLLWGLTKKGKGTIVLPFKDLREKNNALQGTKQKQSEGSKTEKQGKGEEENKIGEVISELLVAELYQIRQIYESAGQSDRQYKQGLQVSNPDICIDAKCFDLNSNNIQNLLAGSSFPIIKFGGGDLAKNIGEVTEIGPVVGNISLTNLIAFLQQILPNIIPGSSSRNRKNISGSIQGTDNKPRLVAHMESGKHFWAWEVDNNKKNIDNDPKLDKQELLSELVKKLAYTIADRLSNHPIDYDNFKKFTEVLESCTQYKRDQNNKSLDDVRKECLDFFKAEPTDIRSFGLLYNLGIASLANGQNEQAEELFRNAISLEPYIEQRICELDVPLGKLKWKKNKKDEVSNTRKILRKELDKDLNPINQLLYRVKSFLRYSWNRLFLSTEGKVLIRLSESLPHALNALGQTLEIKFDKGGCGNPNNCGDHCTDSQKSNESNKSDKCFAYLDESMEAYERASQLATDNALFLSNLASLKIEQVNMLAEKDYLKESKLREAEEELKNATNKEITKNKHLAYNRLGNLYHEQGDYIKAIRKYRQALEAKKDFIVVYRNLGIVYLDWRDFEKAIETFKKGLKILTDSELFHGNPYFKQLHAWLHNSIGWTYLMTVIDDSKNHGNKNCSHEMSSYLTIAKHQFEETITIFEDCKKEKVNSNQRLEIPLYVPYLNLGHVYAWQGNVQEAFENWQLGLANCNDQQNNEVIKMFSYVYKFADKEGSNNKESSQANLPENIHPNIDSEKSHWRLRLRTLYELRVVEQTIKHLQENKVKSCDKKYIKQLDNFDNSFIKKLEENLPSFYLGLAYLWKNDRKSANDRWQQKINKLKDELEEQGDDWILNFNKELWLYIYKMLICCIETDRQSQESNIKSIQNITQETKQKWKNEINRLEKKLEEQKNCQSLKFNNKPWLCIIYKILISCIKIDRESQKSNIKSIQDMIKEIQQKYANPQDNHSIKQICEVLDDINYKFEILKEGPAPFQEQWVVDNLNELFEPILSCRQDLQTWNKQLDNNRKNKSEK